MNNSEQHERNTRALGLLLLAVGAWILIARFIHIDLGFWLWPFWVIVPGGLIMALGFRDTHRSNEGLVIFGSIVAVTGIILFVQNITGAMAELGICVGSRVSRQYWSRSVPVGQAQGRRSSSALCREDDTGRRRPFRRVWHLLRSRARDRWLPVWRDRTHRRASASHRSGCRPLRDVCDRQTRKLFSAADPSAGHAHSATAPCPEGRLPGRHHPASLEQRLTVGKLFL